MGFFDSASESAPQSGTTGAETGAQALTLQVGKKGSADVSVTTIHEFTDPGAFDLAERIARDSLDLSDRVAGDAFALGELSVDRAFDLAESVQFDSARFRDLSVEMASEQVRQAHDFAGDAIGAIAGVSTDAIFTTARLADDVNARVFNFAADQQDFAERLIGDQSAFTLDVLREQSGLVFDAAGQFLSQGQELLRRESTNTEGRIEAITDRALLVGGVVIAGALAAVVLVARR